MYLSNNMTANKMKYLIKENIPFMVKLYHRVRRSIGDYKMSRSFRNLTKEEVFNTLYNWNIENKIESVSGPGSTLRNTENIRSEI